MEPYQIDEGLKVVSQPISHRYIIIICNTPSSKKHMLEGEQQFSNTKQLKDLNN